MGHFAPDTCGHHDDPAAGGSLGTDTCFVCASSYPAEETARGSRAGVRVVKDNHHDNKTAADQDGADQNGPDQHGDDTIVAGLVVQRTRAVGDNAH